MKQILPILFLFLFTSIQAQLEVSPTESTHDTIVNISNEFSSAKIHSNILNVGTTDYTQLKWTIEQTAGPEEWWVQLCVDVLSGGCFGWDSLSNFNQFGTEIPLIIDAGSSSIFDVGVRPNGIPGCGTFVITVAPFNNPSNILATGTFNFRINMNEDCLTVGAEDLEKAKIKISPNPTNSIFTISENEYIEEVEVYNLVGQLMFTQTYNNGDTFDISNYSEGIYLVKMKNKDGQIFKSTKLVKR